MYFGEQIVNFAKHREVKSQLADESINISSVQNTAFMKWLKKLDKVFLCTKSMFFSTKWFNVLQKIVSCWSTHFQDEYVGIISRPPVLRKPRSSCKLQPFADIDGSQWHLPEWNREPVSVSLEHENVGHHGSRGCRWCRVPHVHNLVVLTFYQLLSQTIRY